MSGTPGELKAVPIKFDSDGAKVSSVTFSVDYDETCLSFDSNDNDSDGVADSVNLLVPAEFKSTLVRHDPQDTDGEIDAVLADPTQPFAAMPNGVIMEIALTVAEGTQCKGANADVGFSSSPAPEYVNDEGERLEGMTDNGSVRISTPTPTPTSSATATATSTPTATATPTPVPAKPSLSISKNISAIPGQTVSLPITFNSDGAEISGVTFSLVYDDSCLSFDPKDENQDGLPDSVSLKLPPEFERTLVAAAPDGADREIDVVLADIVLPLALMSDGMIAAIGLDVTSDTTCWGATVDVGFWSNTPATYFGADGEEVAGITRRRLDKHFDVNSDTYGHSNGNLDLHAYPDSDSHTYGFLDSYGHAHGYPNPDLHPYPDSDSHDYSCRDSHGNGYCDTNVHSDSHDYDYRDTDLHAYPDSDSHDYGHRYLDSYGHAHGYCDTNVHSDSHANGHLNSNGHTDILPNCHATPSQTVTQHPR